MIGECLMMRNRKMPKYNRRKSKTKTISLSLDSIKVPSPSKPILNPNKNGSKLTPRMMMNTNKQKNKSKAFPSAPLKSLKSPKNHKKVCNPLLSSKTSHSKAKTTQVLTKNKIKQINPYRDASKKSFWTNRTNLSMKKLSHQPSKNPVKGETKLWNWYLNLKKAKIMEPKKSIKQWNHRK